MSKRIMGNIMLLVTAMIWGAAFVAQTVGMDYVGPFTFQAVRCFLASIVLLPVVAVVDRKGNPKKPVTAAQKKEQSFFGVLCGILLFAACSLQQLGLQYVEAGKAGPVPRQLQNKHYDGADAAVKGQNYLYPHAFPNHWVQQQYLPDNLVGTTYYEWGENKTEQAAKAYWDAIKGRAGGKK